MYFLDFQLPGDDFVLAKPDYNFKRRIKRLLKRFGLEPKNYDLYFHAFTHPSAAENISESYELLEFLGDSVILIHVVRKLVRKYPDERVGLLSKAKSQIVSGEALASVAFDLKLDKYVRIDESIIKYGKGISTNVMADIFEAFVGAIFIDLGMLKVKSFLDPTLKESVNTDLNKRREEDFKSILQEEVQRSFKQIPLYEMIKTSGPDHDKIFYIRAKLRGVNMGKGKGRNKKEAEQEAACKTLKRLNYYFNQIKRNSRKK